MTPEELYNSWKNSSSCSMARKMTRNDNGWEFRLGKFRDENRVRMFISFDKPFLEEKLSIKIIADPNGFDSYFSGRDKPFWKNSGLEYIDFDDCDINALGEFLSWCDTHSPLCVLP